MFWALLGLIFIASFVLVVRAIRVATIDERLDMREIALMKNLSRYARQASFSSGSPRRRPRNSGKSGSLKFPGVPGMGTFTAT